jgi:hypothetical protein
MNHDPLEILRAAGTGKGEVVLHGGTGWNYSIAMNPAADNLADAHWIAWCAHRLREQWPHADPTSLEEAAGEILKDPAMRALPPAEAAVTWLRRGIPDDASRAAWLSDQASSVHAA